MSSQREGAKRMTVPELQGLKGAGRRIVAFTAYDVPTAQLADAAGVDLILVGDSLAMVVLGEETTLGVKLDTMIHHARAVARGARRPLLVGDMPYLTYHTTPAEAVANAGRFIQEAGMTAVKLEGGRKRLPVVRALLDAEIPVLGHIGLTPQSVNVFGGYRVQGRGADGDRVRDDAVSVAEAGAFSIVLEKVPDTLAREVTQAVAVPTIGIGAGLDCDGQVLVVDDMLGMFTSFRPKFVRRYAELGAEADRAIAAYAADVRARRFPGPEHVFAAEPTRR